MEILLLYIVRIALCAGILTGYYFLFLRDKTFHHYNRFYLLFSLLLSLAIPLVRIENFTVEVNENIYILIDKMQYFNKGQHAEENGYYPILLSIIALISLVFLVKFLLGILKIREFKRTFKKERIYGINFYRTDLTEAPFSYFKNLFWKSSIALDSDQGKQILKHEMVHIEEMHTLDKILAEMITAVFWFNPFFYIMKRELNLVHEYLADSRSVKQYGAKSFAKMILESHFHSAEIPATSPFLNSNLKKRLTMLQKPKTKYGYAQRVFALPLLCTIAFTYMVNARNKEINTVNMAIGKTVLRMKKDTVRPQQNIMAAAAERINDKKISIPPSEKDNPENEYAAFYQKTEREKQEFAQKRADAKQELTEIILSERKETAFEEKFPRDRDYDKNPLTETEKELLKSDAEKIAELNRKQNNDGKGDFGLFKFEKTVTKIFDINGNEVKKDEKAPVQNVTLMTISVDGADLFVDGKKVSKEEFLTYQAKFRDARQSPAEIKLFAIERVGDSRKSYAKKMEIITR